MRVCVCLFKSRVLIIRLVTLNLIMSIKYQQTMENRPPNECVASITRPKIKRAGLGVPHRIYNLILLYCFLRIILQTIKWFTMYALWRPILCRASTRALRHSCRPSTNLYVDLRKSYRILSIKAISVLEDWFWLRLQFDMHFVRVS